jgi:hypothetical protein
MKNEHVYWSEEETNLVWLLKGGSKRIYEKDNSAIGDGYSIWTDVIWDSR